MSSPAASGPAKCLPFETCRTVAAQRPAKHAGLRPAGREERNVRPLSVAAAARPVSSAAYTIIADPEDFALTSDLVNVLNGEGLRVLPVVGLGATSALKDITQYGVDFAIVPANALAPLREADPRSAEAIRYVGRLYDEALHVLASRSIADLRALHGSRVNLGPSGGGADIAGRALFAALGIEPVITRYHDEFARQRLESGDLDAAIVLAARPAPSVAQVSSLSGLHLLPVPSDLLPGDAYLPGALEARHYPAVIAAGGSLPTVVVPNVLALHDSPPASERYKRLSRFVREFYARFGELRHPDRPSQWREVDPRTEVRGWIPFRGAEEWLKLQAAGGGERAATNGGDRPDGCGLDCGADETRLEDMRDGLLRRAAGR